MTEAAVTPPLQLALDCANPHAHAKFWAAALGYAVERDGDFILADPEGNEFCVA